MDADSPALGNTIKICCKYFLVCFTTIGRKIDPHHLAIKYWLDKF